MKATGVKNRNSCDKVDHFPNLLTQQEHLREVSTI